MHDRALFGIADGLGIAPDRARLIFGLLGLPGLAAACELGGAQLDIERALGGVDLDDVAILQQADWPADRRLRTDMADAEAARAAGETAVGDQRHVLAGTLAVKRRRRRQHLAHARTAARTFVTDYQHITLLVFLRLDEGETILLAVEAARWATELELETLHAGDFADRTLRREVALEHDEAAGLGQRLLGRMDDILILRHDHASEIF